MGPWILAHPVLFVFGIVLVGRLGLPLPSDPFVLAAGALAGAGKASFSATLAAGVAAGFLADWAWYEAGRRQGAAILRLLCRISLEPDSCVRRTEDLFGRHRVSALLASKVIPGLSTVAAPMAGIIRMERGVFWFFALLSNLAWIFVLEGVGYLLSDRLEEIVFVLSRLTGGLTALVGGSLAVYLLWKYIQRQRFIRSLRIDRMTPEELQRRILAGTDVVVVDLRHPSELIHSPETIPGALRMSPEELDVRHPEIPRDREIVLVCT